jgi:hypothetical protein
MNSARSTTQISSNCSLDVMGLSESDSYSKEQKFHYPKEKSRSKAGFGSRNYLASCFHAG